MARIINKDFGPIYANGNLDHSLRIIRADNSVCVFLNGTEVYNKKTDGNPKLNDRVPLKLKMGQNNISIVGGNTNAKGHYHWELYWGDYLLKDFTANDRPTKKHGVAAVYTFRIIAGGLRMKKAAK